MQLRHLRSFSSGVLLSIILASCTTSMDEVREVSQKDQIVVETGLDTEIIYSENSTVKFKVVGDTVLRHVTESPFIEFISGVNIYFYTEDLKVESKLSSNYAIKYDTSEQITVRDDVVVLNVKGERLNTEELIWDPEKDMIHSDKFVKITRPEEIIYGTGFESNMDFSDYRIMNIKGVLRVDADEIL